MLVAVHFWLTAISGIGLLIGLYFLLAGNPAIEPLVVMSSMAFHAGMLLFAFIAPPALWKAWVRFWRSRQAGSLCCYGTGGGAWSKNIRAVKSSLSFTGVYYVHPVIWILTEWLEPLCLTPPC